MTKQDAFYFITIAALVLGQFIWDCTVPNGLSEWVIYFIPLYLSSKLTWRYSALLAAAFITPLMLLAFNLAPKGIDPGWAYNPGKPQMRNEAMDKVVGNKLEKLSPDMAQAARRAGLKKKVDPRALAASDALMTGLLAKAQASAGNDAIALLRYLFRSEYNYTRHVGKRLKAGDIDSEQAYAEMTLMVLASAETLVLAMPPEGVTSLLAATGKIATSDGRWIVLLNADGGIVTSYPYVIGEGGFEKNHAENGHYFYEISLGSDNRAALAALFGAD